MKKYLSGAVEWMARKFVELAITRAIEITQELGEEYADLPKLTAPKLPEVEYHH